MITREHKATTTTAAPAAAAVVVVVLAVVRVVAAPYRQGPVPQRGTQGRPHVMRVQYPEIARRIGIGRQPARTRIQ